MAEETPEQKKPGPIRVDDKNAAVMTVAVLDSISKKVAQLTAMVEKILIILSQK